MYGSMNAYGTRTTGLQPRSRQETKELGVKQESLFVWYDGKKPYIADREMIGCSRCGAILNGIKPPRTIAEYAAFTVAELGEMLPPLLKLDGNFWYLVDEKLDENWTLSFQMRDYHKTNEVVWKFLDGATTLEKTEADARAKMLIYLIENNIIFIVGGN